MKILINLRHLEIDVYIELIYMPGGLGYSFKPCQYSGYEMIVGNGGTTESVDWVS